MAKEKKLQKVTDFKKIITKNQLLEFLDGNPQEYDDLFRYQFNKYLDSVEARDGQDDVFYEMVVEMLKYKKNEEGEEYFRNQTYENNHYSITNAIHNSIIENRCFPTITLIARDTGLSRQTIYRHLNNGLKDKYNSLVMGKMEYMASHALSKLYLIGVRDNNAAALKNFIELSGAISKQPAANINNYIQINNLRISKDEFDQLPKSTIIQIEKLISENLDLNNKEPFNINS